VLLDGSSTVTYTVRSYRRTLCSLPVGRLATLDFIDPLEEFRPFDDERAEFIMRLADDLRSLSISDVLLDEQERHMLQVAASNMLIMLSMVMGGYELYVDHRLHADALSASLATLIEGLERVNPQMVSEDARKACSEYQQYIDSFEDM